MLLLLLHFSLFLLLLDQLLCFCSSSCFWYCCCLCCCIPRLGLICLCKISTQAFLDVVLVREERDVSAVAYMNMVSLLDLEDGSGGGGGGKPSSSGGGNHNKRGMRAVRGNGRHISVKAAKALATWY